MRTTIEIDAQLIEEVMRITGLPDETTAVEAGLRVLLEREAQLQAISEMRGIGWVGDLAEIREDRPGKGSR